jgi:Memo-like protein
VQVPADLQDARVRSPAVAGLFYPRDPARLQTEVMELLGQHLLASKVMPKALIAPHAGYIYSGRIAGVAFAKLRASAQTITRVVLIGPAHYVHLSGIAAPRVEAFETPLGCVRVDTETCCHIGRFEFVSQTDASMSLSTLWKWNCRFYRSSFHPSSWCLLLWATRLRRKLRKYCANCGMDRRR